MIDVTVVIPNYNGIKYLNACLEALYQQVAAPKFEILIVDNGSVDGSVEAAKEWLATREEEAPSTRFLCLAENTGFCHAVNVGIQASEAPYVLLLNNDTRVMPEFVGQLYRTIQKSSRIFSVSAKMLMWDKPELVDDAGDLLNVLGWASSIGKGKPADRYNKPAFIFSACGGAAIYRRSVLEEIGLFDELHFAYLEDVDLGYRARIYGYRNLYEPKAEVLHYGSASSGSRYNEFKAKLASANNVYILYKNMPIFQLVWNFPLLLLGFLMKLAFYCRKGMGSVYLKGLVNGLKRCTGREGQAHKVPYLSTHLKNYVRIQIELYINVLKFVFSY